MLQVQRKTDLFAAVEVTAPLGQRVEARAHDPCVARGFGAVQRHLCQRKPQECGVGLRVIGKQRNDFRGAVAVEQEVGVGNQQKVIVGRIGQRVAVVRFGVGRASQTLARFRQQTYQAAVQLRLEAAQAASPPSDPS